MGCYHIPLDAYSQRLCTMIDYYHGKIPIFMVTYGYNQQSGYFPGCNCSNHGCSWQSRVCTYLYQRHSHHLIGQFEDHLKRLQEVLQRLKTTGFQANVCKCFFAETQLNYLGYYLTRDVFNLDLRKWKQYYVYPHR